MARLRIRGMTLVELLATVTVMAILAALIVPSLSFNDSTKLAVAAQQVGNALRFARSEAMRTGQSVLVDAETTPGRLLLLLRGCVSAVSPAVLDPQTRRAYDVDVADGAFSGGVALVPNFLVGGTAWAGLEFDNRGTASQACSIASQTPRGTPEAGSSINLVYGGNSATIQIDPPTGRVTGF